MAKDANAFVDWLTDAKAGDSYTYHEGFLSRDRDVSGPAAFELGIIAGLASKAYQTGKVTLVQQRLGDGKYLYIAQATGRRVAA